MVVAKGSGGEIAPLGADANVVVSSDGRGATGATGIGRGATGTRDVVTDAWSLEPVADYEVPRREDFRPR